jgi:hypothetical protein
MAKSDLRVGISADSSKFDKAMADVRSSLSKTKQDTKKNTDDISKDYDALSGKLQSALDNISGGMLSQFKEGYEIVKNVANILSSFKGVELIKGGANGNNSFASLKESLSGMFDSFLNNMPAVKSNLATMAASTAAANVATQTFKSSLTQVGSSAAASAAGVKLLTSSLTKSKEFEEQANNLKGMVAQYTHLQKQLRSVEERLRVAFKFKHTESGAKQFEHLTQKAESLNKKIANLRENMKAVSSSMKGVGSQAQAGAKSVASSSTSMAASAASMGGAFKGAGAAAKAAFTKFGPIIAGALLVLSPFIVAIKSLKQYFNSTQEGINELEIAQERLNVATSVFWDRLAWGKGLAKAWYGILEEGAIRAADAFGTLSSKWANIANEMREGAVIAEAYTTALKNLYAAKYGLSQDPEEIGKGLDYTNAQLESSSAMYEALAASTDDLAEKNEYLEKAAWGVSAAYENQIKEIKDLIEAKKLAATPTSNLEENAKELSEYYVKLENLESAKWRAERRFARQIESNNKSLAAQNAERKKELDLIKQIQAYANKAGFKVTVTKENMEQVKKEIETSLSGLDLIPTFRPDRWKEFAQQTQDYFKKNPIKAPVIGDFDLGFKDGVEGLEGIQQSLKDLAEEVAEDSKEVADSYISYLQGELNKLPKSLRVKLGLDVVVTAENMESVGNTLEEKVNKPAEEKIAKLNEDLNDILKNGIVQGISDTMEALGEAFTSGDFMSVAATMMESLADLLKQFGSALIAYAISVEAFKQAFAAPWVAIAAGAALTIAGAALGAVANKLKATDFAEGGIVYGETYARVAEYSGARNNPEVIAPLDRLKSILGDSQNTIGGEVKFRVSGSELVGVLNNHNRRVSKFG